MRKIEVAWAAGIIDGEGCIHMHKHNPRRPYYSLVLKVTMGHAPTIARLRDIFETGSIQINNSNRGHNVAWSWLCTTRQAEGVLKVVRPYLFTKAEEADLALEYLRLPVMPGTAPISDELRAERERLFNALRDIKPSARFRKVFDAEG